MRSTIFKIIAGSIISALMFGSAKAQQPVALEAKSREQTQRLADELLGKREPGRPWQ